MESLIKNRANLINKILSRYNLPLKGLHGCAHWMRVLINGYLIAEYNPGGNIDMLVVEMFALLHDSRRETEDHCIKHSMQASKFVHFLKEEGHLKQLKEGQFWTLNSAIERHTFGSTSTSEEETIAACWDADRLDLWRVGVCPISDYMSTDFGKYVTNEPGFKKNWRTNFFEKKHTSMPIIMENVWPELWRRVKPR